MFKRISVITPTLFLLLSSGIFLPAGFSIFISPGVWELWEINFSGIYLIFFSLCTYYIFTLLLQKNGLSPKSLFARKILAVHGILVIFGLSLCTITPALLLIRIAMPR